MSQISTKRNSKGRNLAKWYAHIPYRALAHYGLVALYVFVLAPVSVLNTPELGVDGSWMLALPVALEKGLTYGSEFLFTYGPLGHLVTRIPYHLGKFQYALFDAYFLVNLAYILHYVLKRHNTLVTHIIIYLLILILGLFYNPNMVMILSWVLLFMLLYFVNERRPAALLNAILLTILLFYTKANVGIIVVFFLYSCLAFCAFTRRITLRAALVYAGLHLGGTLLLSFLLRVDLPVYFVGSLHLISAYNDAMYLELENLNVLYAALVLVAAFGAICLWHFRTLLKDHSLFYAVFISSLMLYVAFKQGFVRADGHYLAFFTYSPLFLSLLVIFDAQPALRKALARLVLLAVFLAFVAVHGNLNALFYFGLPTKVQLLKTYVADLADPQRKYDYTALKAQRIIPESILRQIGNHTVDLVPSELSYVLLNDLNYHPRPLIQSYSAYDAYLDGLNYQKYLSEDGPEYILFTYNSIDVRYPLFDETRTKLAMLANYEVVDRSWQYMLLKRLAKRGSLRTVKTKKGSGRLNEPIPLQRTRHLQVLKPTIEYSILGKLRRLLYQPPKLFVTFTLGSGQTKVYRAIATIVNGGVIVNKYVETDEQADLFISSNGVSNRHVSSVTFHTDAPWAFRTEFDYTNELVSVQTAPKSRRRYVTPLAEGLPAEGTLTGDLTGVFEDDENYFEVGGWAAISGMGAEQSKISVVLQSDQRTYVCNTVQGNRHDVTEYFKTFNYDESGFYAYVPKDGLASGRYKLGIQIEKRDTVTNQFIKVVQFTGKVIEKDFSSHAQPVRLAQLPAATDNIGGDLTGVFEDDENSFKVGGWAAINGMGAENAKISVVLQSDRHSYVCPVTPYPRPDVTAYFKTFNYDQAGYQTAVSKQSLAPGRYKLGIQIIKEDSASRTTLKALQFTDKVVEK